PIPKSKENDYVTAIQEIGDDTFLIGTNFSGIYKLDLRQKSVGIEKVFNRFKESKINCFYPFSDTETLIGTDGGLFVYYCEQNTVERIGHPPDFDTAVRSIVKWDDNTLLVGGFLNTYLLDHRLQW